MIHLHFVGDGPRDEAMMPRLIERILKVDVHADFREWKSIHLHGKGYGKKLAFAIRVARDAAADGLVATVDADKAPQRERLRELQSARDDDRSKAPSFPTALGEAVPQAESWLLDDPVAVRQVMRLRLESTVPTIRQTKSPKQTLEDLRTQGENEVDDVLTLLAAIAREVQPSRCQHAKETGFNRFVADVQRELGTIVARA